MQLEIRKAMPQDLPAVLRVIEEARRSLARLGVDQWQDGTPGAETLAADVAVGYSWVGLRDGLVLATAALMPGPEEDYHPIEGAWHTPETYAAIHRVATSDAARGSGAAGELFAHLMRYAAQAGCPALRIDTHHQNLRMQRFLAKQGFAPCGTIYLKNGAPRLGFDRFLRLDS